MKKSITNGTDFEIKDTKMDFYEGITATQIIERAGVKTTNKKGQETVIQLISPVPNSVGKYTLEFVNSSGDSANMELELVAPKK
jgi:hypothetical protein